MTDHPYITGFAIGVAISRTSWWFATGVLTGLLIATAVLWARGRQRAQP